MGMVKATVRHWYAEEGWGVVDCPETPGGCFVHFSNLEMAGYRELAPDAEVGLEWEAPGFKQDGYDFRALKVRLRFAEPGSEARATSASGSAGRAPKRRKGKPRSGNERDRGLGGESVLRRIEK
jgi:CspA family cold shock protein